MVLTEIDKRRDAFDRIISEFIRKNRKTTMYVAKKIGCDTSSLWRYRKKTEYFKRMPLDILAESLKLANTSNEDIRIILGLPTGKVKEYGEN